jgi:hypothetical protein
MATLKRNNRGKKMQAGGNVENPSVDPISRRGAFNFDNYKKSLKKDTSLSDKERNRRIRKASKIFASLPDTRVIVDKSDNQTIWKWENAALDDSRQGGVADVDKKGVFGGKGFAGLVGGEFEEILDDMVSRETIEFDELAPEIQEEVQGKMYRKDGTDLANPQKGGQTSNMVVDEGITESSTGGEGNGEKNKQVTKTEVDKRTPGDQTKIKEEKDAVDAVTQKQQVDTEGLKINTGVINDTDIPKDYTLDREIPSPEDEAHELEMDLDYIERLRLLSNPELNFQTQAPNIASFSDVGETDFWTGLTPMQKKINALKSQTGADYFYTDPNGALIGRKGAEYYVVPKNKTARGTKEGDPIRYVGDPTSLLPLVEGIYPKFLQQVGKVYGDKFDSIMQTQDDSIIAKDKSGKWKKFRGKKGRGGSPWVDYTPSTEDLKSPKRKYLGRSPEQMGLTPPQMDKVNSTGYLVPVNRTGGILYKTGGKIRRYQWGQAITAGLQLAGNFINNKQEKAQIAQNQNPTAPSMPASTGGTGDVITLQVPRESIMAAIGNGGQPGAAPAEGGGGFMQNLGNIMQGADSLAGVFSKKDGGTIKPKFQNPSGPLFNPYAGFSGQQYTTPGNTTGTPQVNMPGLNPVLTPGVTSMPAVPDKLAPVPIPQIGGGNDHTLTPPTIIHDRGGEGGTDSTGGTDGFQNTRTVLPGVEPVLDYLFSKPQSVEISRKPLMNFDPMAERTVTGLPEDVRRRAMKGFQDQMGRYRESVDPTVNLLRGLQVDKAKGEFQSSLAQEDLGERMRTEEIRRHDQARNKELERQVKETNAARTYEDDVAQAEANLNKKLAEQQRTGNLAKGLYNSVTDKRTKATAYDNYLAQQNYQAGLQDSIAGRRAAYNSYSNTLMAYKNQEENAGLTDQELIAKYPDLKNKYTAYTGAGTAVTDYQDKQGQDMVNKFYHDINSGPFSSIFNLFKKKNSNGGLLMRKGGTVTRKSTGTEKAAGIRASAAIQTELMRLNDKEKDRRLEKKKLNFQTESLLKKYNVVYFNKLRMKP